MVPLGRIDVSLEVCIAAAVAKAGLAPESLGLLAA